MLYTDGITGTENETSQELGREQLFAKDLAKPDICIRAVGAGTEVYAADTISLRSVTSDNFVIIDTTGDVNGK